MNHDEHFFISEPDKVRHQTGSKIVCFSDTSCAVEYSIVVQ